MNTPTECQECVRLIAEIAVLRADIAGLRERCRVLMDLINEVNRAVKEGRIEVSNK